MAIPILPTPPMQYERRYLDELNRVLRLFFTRYDTPEVFQTARLQILDNDGGVIIDTEFDTATSKTHIILSNLPTSASGLAVGTVYNDSGTLKVAT
jgi:hypothetical protein